MVLVKTFYLGTWIGTMTEVLYLHIDRTFSFPNLEAESQISNFVLGKFQFREDIKVGQNFTLY